MIAQPMSDRYFSEEALCEWKVVKHRSAREGHLELSVGYADNASLRFPDAGGGGGRVYGCDPELCERKNLDSVLISMMRRDERRLRAVGGQLRLNRGVRGTQKSRSSSAL